MTSAARPGGGASAGAGHRRSIRAEIVERLVRNAVRDQVRRAGRESLEVLDAGGGTGSVAVPLAEEGHRVLVVDPSPDSLAALERRAAEAGVTGRIDAVQGDAAGVLDVVPEASVDLVLCHNVLEVVDDCEAALRAMARATRPTGALSLIAANRYAVVWAKALAGHTSAAHQALVEGDGPSRFTLDELEELLERTGYRAVSSQGVRIFTDLVPALGAERGQPPEPVESLLALELAASEHPTFRGLGTHLHIFAHLK